MVLVYTNHPPKDGMRQMQKPIDVPCDWILRYSLEVSQTMDPKYKSFASQIECLQHL